MSASLDTLPKAMLELMPALKALTVTDESRATCNQCPIEACEGEEPGGRRPFRHGLRCCTFSPSVPSFYAGRILRRGGQGAKTLRRRIRSGEGVEARGVRQTEEWAKLYDERKDEGFGVDADLLCPHWVPGPLGCSIWHDRSATCRSWHCMHDDGMRSILYWNVFQTCINILEDALIQCCLEDGDVPESFEDTDVVEAWYLWCAEHIESLNSERIGELLTDQMKKLDEVLMEVHNEVGEALPERVELSVVAIEPDGDHLWMRGVSAYSWLRLPRMIFSIVPFLTGEMGVDDALGAANEQLPEEHPPWTREDLVPLWRAGLLHDPGLDVQWSMGMNERPSIPDMPASESKARVTARFGAGGVLVVVEEDA